MILEFKTARNANGNRKYLYIDTDKKIYSTLCRKMIVDGIEIKSKDFNNLHGKLIESKEYIDKTYIDY